MAVITDVPPDTPVIDAVVSERRVIVTFALSELNVTADVIYEDPVLDADNVMELPTSTLDIELSLGTVMELIPVSAVLNVEFEMKYVPRKYFVGSDTNTPNTFIYPERPLLLYL